VCVLLVSSSVNDLGGSWQGEGKSSKAADTVVDLIRSRGGTAVANYDSVEEGDKLVQTAIDNFGRIDILINNAGILRDRSFLKMTEKDWDLVHTVHLKGAFMVTRAALPYMRKQNYGRVVVTSSTSGLYGSFGQINYSAAKMGLVGFSHTLAMEGAKYNILSNTIVPIAYSRMSATVMAPQLQDILKPEYVAPIVAYLCHEDCQDTGGVFECAGGWTGKVRLQETEGATFTKPITIEEVRDKWDQVCDWNRVMHHKTAAEVASMVLEKVTDEGENSDSGDVVAPYTFTNRDVILYALGVGAEVSQTNTSELKFLYEGHEDFSTIPSFAVLPAMNSVLNGIMAKGIPGVKEFHPANVLHGEQYVELKKPFPTEGTVTCEGKLVDVLDKRSGAVMLVDVETKNEAGELLCVNQFSTFIMGAGGFGGKRSSPHAKSTVPAPSRAPDASLQHKTLPIQAAIYRLSGDYNPLHIDPEFAKVGGFSTPILHGLCSYGIATRHIMRQYCNNDTTMVKAIKTRFVKPVYPGETIQTDMWREGSRIHYRFSGE
jgi:3-hydroxyacyl-CoA dehydrogenase/3a,7a,12a-trihydroxy-5b-cholest-24-enoyl-CoA hydratase